MGRNLTAIPARPRAGPARLTLPYLTQVKANLAGDNPRSKIGSGSSQPKNPLLIFFQIFAS
jgi:hypothetical protein